MPLRITLAILLVTVLSLPALAVDPWPAEPAVDAVNLTHLEGPDPNDFHEDLSGAFWNPLKHRLWLCRNGGGSFDVEYRAGLQREWTCL